MTIYGVFEYLGEHAAAITLVLAILGAFGAFTKYILDKTIFNKRNELRSSVASYSIKDLESLLRSIGKLREKPNSTSAEIAIDHEAVKQTIAEAKKAAKVLSTIRDKLRPIPLDKIALPEGVQITKLDDTMIGLKIFLDRRAVIIRAIFLFAWLGIAATIFIYNWGNWLTILFFGVMVGIFAYSMMGGVLVELCKNEYTYRGFGWTKYKRKPEIELKVIAREGRYQAIMEIDGTYVVGKSRTHDSQSAAADELIDFYRSLNWWLERPIMVAEGVFVGPD